MDATDAERTVAREVITYARQQGFTGEFLNNESIFQHRGRWIIFWRKHSELPCSGRTEDSQGGIHYSMQGVFNQDALDLMVSASSGEVLTEAGTLATIEEAFVLLKAWLLDNSAVDNLPRRLIRRYGIS